MWEALTSHPRGRLSTRKYLSFATAFLVVCFAYIFITAPTTHAADAQWAGNDITYNGNTYKGPKKASDAPSLHLPISSIYYVFVDNPAPGAATKKAYVIYFAPGADPGTSTTAQYRTYTLSNNGEFSNPSTDQVVTLSRAESLPDATSDGSSSCEIDRIGWIVCPVTDFLAWGMDTLYSALSSFLKVQPLQSGNNSLYRAWEAGRNIANIAFILGFLMVIYSYITSAGLSNYNIKKMIPRLVVAAILVNISYWICAVAVDVSNILGYSVQDLFMNLREQVVGTETNNSFDWAEISTYVLSGGTIGAVGLVAATGGSVVSGIFLLLGALVVVLFAAFVAVVILAARQALITVLIIAAPLAFVAYLLPNTEKWFEKWRSVFMTMLLLFPIFSVIFGGSQLAGAAIIQNADNLSVLILGMAVQIAPLVITPLLIKFSGGLIGQIAGMTNNRSKGIVDGARNWAKGNAELRKQKSLGTPNRKYNRANFARRSAQAMNRGRLSREGMTKNYQERAENLFNDSRKGHALHEAHHEVEQAKQLIEQKGAIRLQAKLDPKDVSFDAHALSRELTLRATTDSAKSYTDRMDALYDEAKHGELPQAPIAGPVMGDIMRATTLAQVSTEDLALTAIRKSQAAHEVSSGINKKLLSSNDLQKYAAGIGDHELMLAGVVAKDREEYGKHVGAQQQLMKHFKLESDDYQDIAMSKQMVTRTDTSGNTHTFSFNNEYSKEAAIENQFVAGSYKQKLEIIKETGENILVPGGSRVGVNYDHRSTVQDATIKSGFNAQAPFINDKTFDSILKGQFNGDKSVAEHAIRQVFEGRISSEILSRANDNALRILFGARNPAAEFSDPSERELRTALEQAMNEFRATHTAAEISKFESYYSEMQENARTVLDTPTIRQNTKTEAEAVLRRYRV